MYQVAEFARLAGVTVRTLHHYDAIGLLRPQRQGRQRVYSLADLLRLQHILTLKWLGFTLDDIRTLLANRVDDPRALLEAQQAAVRAQMAQLQAADAALTGALQTVDQLGADALDPATLALITGSLMPGTYANWIRRYYTDDQLPMVAARGQAFAPEQLRQWEAEWAEIIDRFRRCQPDGPDSPAAQALAGRVYELVSLFTGGDETIAASLQQMYADVDAMPAPFRPFDADLGEFIAAAVQTYRARREAPGSHIP